jgi:phosphonate transport system permease protein
VIRFAILPRVFPVLLSHVLYYLESNINDWDEVAFIILMILVVVTGIDACARAVRLRVIRGAR